MTKITLPTILAAANYRITGGSDYKWHCYGTDAHILDIDGIRRGGEGHTIHIVFDKLNQTVYEVEAWDNDRDRTYRWVNPIHRQSLLDEYVIRGLDSSMATEIRKYIEIEVDEDMLEKVRAIEKGDTYDERIQVQLNFDDSEMLLLMRMAHEHDMTLNKFVEHILTLEIERLSKPKIKVAHESEL